MDIAAKIREALGEPVQARGKPLYETFRELLSYLLDPETCRAARYELLKADFQAVLWQHISETLDATDLDANRLRKMAVQVWLLLPSVRDTEIYYEAQSRSKRFHRVLFPLSRMCNPGKEGYRCRLDELCTSEVLQTTLQTKILKRTICVPEVEKDRILKSANIHFEMPHRNILPAYAVSSGPMPDFLKEDIERILNEEGMETAGFQLQMDPHMPSWDFLEPRLDDHHQVLMFMCQVLSAVVWLNSHNIQHRDLTFDNIMKMRQGHFVVGGLDHATAGDWADLGIWGDTSHNAPESVIMRKLLEELALELGDLKRRPEAPEPEHENNPDSYQFIQWQQWKKALTSAHNCADGKPDILAVKWPRRWPRTWPMKDTRSVPPLTKTDVWSCGLLLYRLIDQDAPEDVMEKVDGWTAVFSGEPVPPCNLRPNFPSGLAKLCEEMLEYNVDKRITAQEALLRVQFMLWPLPDELLQDCMSEEANLQTQMRVDTWMKEELRHLLKDWQWFDGQLPIHQAAAALPIETQLKADYLSSVNPRDLNKQLFDLGQRYGIEERVTTPL
jgi:serine/threonine protein kinase